MSVYQRKSDGLWVVAWHVDGKKKTKAFREEQTARAYESERLASFQPGYDRLTFGELVVMFFRSHPDYHEKTKGNVLFAVTGREDKQGNHIEGYAEFMRDKYADALNRQDLERLREAIRASESGNNTINKYQAYFRAILAWGADQELIVRNPWRDFKRLPVKKRIVTTTITDMRAAYQQAPDWLQWAIMTMYALSLRPGLVELFGLLWTAFDWRRGIVRVIQGKSGHVKTVIPPAQYMEIAYQKYIEDMRAGIPWVCHRRGNKVLNYRYNWDRAVKLAGVKHFPMYDVRHIAASEMLASGADLSAVSAQLGHSSVATTGAIYTHVTPGGQARAAALLPGLEQKEDDPEEVQ